MESVTGNAFLIFMLSFLTKSDLEINKIFFSSYLNTTEFINKFL